LILDRDLLILDEPTTGVDPLSRRQFWRLIELRADRPGIAVLDATAYVEEASRVDWLAAMNGGTVLATGAPGDLLERKKSRSLEQAFIALLPEDQRAGYQPVHALDRCSITALRAARGHGLRREPLAAVSELFGPARYRNPP
jgi:ribosome-dependent ATPase